ncbi:MAG TPA: alpha/beta hydrolase [Solirubrobacterales bacterium]|jgi:pimeloyl-ACP methyl ester carboxylesterase|nr:alpha/beta hydrolase [Solirubrobacterales bacterium]
MAEPPHVDGTRHRYVEARGLRFHVAEAGEGDDVVLCLHGWPQHWYEWRFLLPALAAAGHRAIAVDLRGFGWSDAPPDGYEKENLADDVLAVLDQLGHERVKLVGHDWGGWIGYLLCLRAPERFEKYLALNILTPWVNQRMIASEAWRFLYQPLVASPFLGYHLHASGTIVPKILVGASVVRDNLGRETLHIFSDNLAEPDRARACVQMYRVFLVREQPDLIRGRYTRQRLTVPTLHLHGTEDTALRPKMLAGWQRHADDMRVELVEGCGHFIADEAPDLVADRAITFFRAPI